MAQVCVEEESSHQQNALLKGPRTGISLACPHSLDEGLVQNSTAEVNLSRRKGSYLLERNDAIERYPVLSLTYPHAVGERTDLEGTAKTKKKDEVFRSLLVHECWEMILHFQWKLHPREDSP